MYNLRLVVAKVFVSYDISPLRSLAFQFEISGFLSDRREVKLGRLLDCAVSPGRN